MKNKKLLGAVAIGGALALALAGCASGSGNTGGGDNGEKVETKTADYNPQDRSNLQEGGEVNFPINEIPEQLNGFNSDASADTARLWSWYMPQILLVSPEGEVTKNDAYLDAYEIGEEDGNTTITFTFKDEAHFNDGTDMDWTSIDATWKANRSYDEGFNPNATDGYKQIKTVEQGDTAKTAVVTFDGIYAWPSMAFLTGGVLHPDIADPTVFNEAFIGNMHPEWGAGPYKVDRVDFNSGEVSFVKNEKWWGDEGKLDKFTYRALEAQATINAFQAGEIDAASVATKDRLQVAQSMGEDKAEIRTAMTPSNYLVTLNADAPTLKEKEVRQAIMTGIDRTQLAKIRFNGLNYTEELPGSFLLFQTQDGYEDNFGAEASFDPEKAKTILDDAGWTEGAGGIREKDGQKLSPSFTLLGDDPEIKAEATALQKMMKDIGVDLQIRERPTSDFSKVTSERDFDMFQMGFSSTDPFGVVYLDQVYNSKSELNKSGTGSKELDEKIREVQQIGDPDEQIEKANELEKEAFAEYGIMPTFNGPAIIAVKPGLANYGAPGFSSVAVQDIGWEK